MDRLDLKIVQIWQCRTFEASKSNAQASGHVATQMILLYAPKSIYTRFILSEEDISNRLAHIPFELIDEKRMQIWKRFTVWFLFPQFGNNKKLGDVIAPNLEISKSETMNHWLTDSPTDRGKW